MSANDMRNKPSGIDRRLLIGCVVTVVWIGCMVGLVYWKYDCELTLNEIGDFIAGAFAPVAFFWLVLGYMQQGEELKQNTAALQLQAEELRLAVKEYKQMNANTDRHLRQLENQRAEDLANAKRAMRMLLTPVQVTAPLTNHDAFMFSFRNLGHQGTSITATLRLDGASITSNTDWLTLKKDEFLRLDFKMEYWSDRNGTLSFSYLNGEGEADVDSFKLFVRSHAQVFIGRVGPEADALAQQI